MSLADSAHWNKALAGLQRAQGILRFGAVEFWAVNPPEVLIGSALVRMALQILFLTALGSVVAGAQQAERAFIGAIVLATAMTNILYVSEVPISEKESATFWRLRMARFAPWLILCVRSWGYVVAGFVLAMMAAAIMAPLIGMSGLAIQLMPLAPILFAVSVTSTAAGLAAAAFAVGRRVETLASNLLAYLVMLTSGAFLPVGQLPLLDALGTCMPGRNGLLVIHAELRGDPWASDFFRELCVGAGWVAVFVLLMTIQCKRAHRGGHDDFA